MKSLRPSSVVIGALVAALVLVSFGASPQLADAGIAGLIGALKEEPISVQVEWLTDLGLPPESGR